MKRHARLGILASALIFSTSTAESFAQGKQPAQTPEAGEATPAPPTLDQSLGSLLGRSGGLLSADVARRAAVTSFDVRSRLNELDAAAAGVDEALVAYFPRLSLTGRYTRLSSISQSSLGNLVAAPGAPDGPLAPGAALVSVPLSFPVLLNQYILQASLSVPLSDYLLRIPQAYAAATHSRRAAELTAEATKWKTATDAKALYYTWVRAKLQQVVSDQALEQARAHLVDAQHAFDVGTLSRADVLRLESQVAASQLVVERSRNLVVVAETQLRVAMHDPGDKPYEVGERVDEELPPFAGGDVAMSAMWAEARERRLEVRALSQTADSYHQRAKVARAGYLPRVDAFGDAIYANPNNRFFPAQDTWKGTWDAGLSLTFAPNDAATAASSVRSAEAQAAEAINQREALFDGIRNEVTQSRQDRREAELAIETTRQGLASAEESYRVRRALFRHGRATAVELTDAETDLTRARLDSINARIDLRIATVRLAHALGRDVIQESR